ncbi:MAG TPA: enoyl-ACP reductase [Bryobacteraceae bacterium]|jgi:enoyl-[acyl-carrier protein] reductase I|nr:enoyl-ACP reductase [Bryobacteraceae bacterium]
MSKLLEGKLALVLGIANKWSLAYAIAEAFSREGATLALSYLGARQKESIHDLSQGWNVAAVLPCDVTKDEELSAMTKSLRELGRPLDAVVHSLAFANREDLSRPLVEASREGFLLAHNVSAYSLVAVAGATAPLMSDGGSLTTLTYAGSTRVVPNYNMMGLAKASLEAATRYLASELGPQKIRVNAISAGPVKTASARAVKDFSTILETTPKHAPLRRNTDPAEVGDAAVFLASHLGRGVTGNILFVDSGIHVMGL